ncbi:hypothetical protein FIBSPDRAFT_945258 [Athelia psychrophila]|uniref:HNH nuclease domain-containing protein n=1 Tax=Athelia psychrophila TaxID=1759441 RepID=A0A166U226_9AGAM|nr:hypothetical protein FIBSPDRAFT_945258 [Fibularhizoctonia sp. CBS 109695]
MSEHYIPTAYDLAVGGNPFAYGAVSISTVTRSQTEAFNTGINARDLGQCIICGYGDPIALEHAHIIPKVEDDTWADLKTRGFIPSQCKSVEHETRNGILLCCNHHRIFDAYKFYIRWVPDLHRFILINHSVSSSMEQYHGRTVNLRPNCPRLPFHGAFLIHEMRVRGFWPSQADRPIALPILEQDWISGSSSGPIPPASGNITPSGSQPLPTLASLPFLSTSLSTSGGGQQDQSGSIADPLDTDTQPKVLHMTNPFANPAGLAALKHSFAEQANWKAAQLEGESWEGTAEENVAKWHAITAPDTSVI